jgi:2-methylcitrate dehydratase PrpD
MTIAESFSEFLINMTYDELPEQAVDHAAMIIASTLASAACGRHINSSQIVSDIEIQRGGTPEASVWFEKNVRLPVIGTARANALMSDAAASDDSDLRNIVHAGTPLTAAALAAAEAIGTSGKDILAAIVVGYEAAGRIGEAIMPKFDYRGHHGCMGAAFGPTIAVARLYGLNPEQAAHALALTATTIGGLTKAANTSIAREYHAGNAIVAGISAVQAAMRGYTAELSIFEIERGFCQLFGGSDGTVILEDLGADWDIVTDMALKLVPGGHPYHALGEAGANAAREANVASEEIASITISRPGMTKLTGPRHPKDLIDMAHSPAYFTAAGVHDRMFGWVHASQEKIDHPGIHALIDKVTVGAEPTANVAAYRQGATVSIETTDGRIFTNSVFVPRGAGCAGIDWSDVEEKCLALMPTAPLGNKKINLILTKIRNMPELDNASDLTACLV